MSYFYFEIMYNERVKRLVRLYEDEFPILVKEYYNEFSAKYTYKYNPLSSVDTSTGKVSLFTFIEDYIKNNYKVPYKIDKHFEFHSNSLFYAPTDEFGMSISIKSREDLPEIFNDQCLNDYGYLNDFGIFSHSFLGITGLSNVVKKKIKDDLELECKLIKLRLRSDLKRFFIQGQVDWRWIVIDQIYYYGVDKFPNCLDHEFSQLEYGIGFHEKFGRLGSWNYGEDENGYEIKRPAFDKKIRQLEDKFYSNLKVKKFSDYSYHDVLEEYLLRENIKEITSTYKTKEANNIFIKANCERLGKVPLLNLREKLSFIKEQWDCESVYLSYLKYRSRNADTDVTPFVFPINFKLDIKDVFNDEILIHDYLETFNEPENEIRKLFGLPKIGEGWISETNLFYEIKTYFKDEVVIHHGRPNWLGKQHLDIYIPKHNVGVEYQGDQHYYPIEFFGGETSYIKNKVRDETKKQLCLENKCHLIYVNPGYRLDEVIYEIENAISKFS